MDVSNLIPPSQPPRSDGAEKRTRELGLPPPPTAAAEQAARSASTGRPAASASVVRDRVERSPEFERQLREWKESLVLETPERRTADLEAIRSEIAAAKDASHETLMRAAQGILEGELFFLAAGGS
jgi:hypothetical protein